MKTETNVILVVCAFFLATEVAIAGSATWNLNPTSGDWNTAGNWTPNTIPNNPSDVATFEVSNTSSLTLSTNTSVAGIVFNPGASAFNINNNIYSLNIYDSGVTNNSGSTQQFVLPVDSIGRQGSMQFFSSATAGTDTIYTLQGSTVGSLGGYINFWDTSTAGDASFVLEGPGNNGNNAGGRVTFTGNSTAGNGNFTINPGGGAATQAFVAFYDTSNGGNATITANGASTGDETGGNVFFSFDSNAGNATLIANGTQTGFAAGSIGFADAASGGNAQVRVFGTGTLDITGIDHPSLTIGSIEGDGNVSLADRNLVVGRNNLSTRFDGVISGIGSLTKIGGGRLTLTNGNTYSGGTTIQRGTLLLSNKTADSTTGTGNVTIEGGTLKGNGIVGGNVLVGAGSGHRAVIEPQASNGGVYLTVQKSLTMNSDATCRIDINSNNGFYGIVIAKGVTINGARFAISDSGNSSLGGVHLVMISNVGREPIAGTFSNLPDGGTIVVGQNTFQANYHGGDGNDLELTTVP